MLRWMIPMPPCCASAMARCDSVTVSMAELTTGMFSAMCRVRQVRVSVFAGSTLLRAGCKSTSSKVRPSGMASEIMEEGNFYYAMNGYDELAREETAWRLWV